MKNYNMLSIASFFIKKYPFIFSVRVRKVRTMFLRGPREVLGRSLKSPCKTLNKN